MQPWARAGVVRDAKVRDEVPTPDGMAVGTADWHVLGSIESPITGPKGNIEFLLAGERGTRSEVGDRRAGQCR